MIEVRGNLWEYEADFRCITTNGFIKTNGAAVMGRGCALEATQKYPGIDEVLGFLLKEHGNHVHELSWFDPQPSTQQQARGLLSFPVKHNWRDKADPDLIRRSASELRKFIDDYDRNFDAVNTVVVVPRPGCGNGQLRWEDVKPILEPYFDDRFHVITF